MLVIYIDKINIYQKILNSSKNISKIFSNAKYNLENQLAGQAWENAIEMTENENQQQEENHEQQIERPKEIIIEINTIAKPITIKTVNCSPANRTEKKVPKTDSKLSIIED